MSHCILLIVCVFSIEVFLRLNYIALINSTIKVSRKATYIILNKNIKATNYQIDTYKNKIYIYGIALNFKEKNLVIDEAKQILNVKDVIASILLVEDLRIQKN